MFSSLIRSEARNSTIKESGLSCKVPPVTVTGRISFYSCKRYNNTLTPFPEVGRNGFEGETGVPYIYMRLVCMDAD